MVEYYSPSCGHCVNLAPEYEKLAKQLKESESKYVIAAVNMKDHEQVREWVDINGFPTIRFYAQGNEFDYETGGRKAEDFLSFMDNVVNAKLTVAKSKEEVETPAVFISGIEESSPLHKIGVKFTRFPVYLLEGSSEFKVEILTKKGYSSYSGDAHLDAVANWIAEHSEDTIIQVTNPATSKKLNNAL